MYESIRSDERVGLLRCGGFQPAVYKTCVYIVALLVFAVANVHFLSAQEVMGRIECYDYIDPTQAELIVSPDGRLWVCNGVSYVSVGQDIQSNWICNLRPQRVHQANKADDEIWRGGFFNADTMILSGRILDRSSKSKWANQIWKSIDGGRTWELREYDASGSFAGVSIRSVWTSPDGEAWMGGDDGSIYHSRDFGDSWERTKLTNEPIEGICFNSHGVGLAYGREAIHLFGLAPLKWTRVYSCVSPLELGRSEISQPRV